MGTCLYFRTAGPVAAEVEQAIRDELPQANRGAQWIHCEPIAFFSDTEDGRLTGFSKLNFHPHPDEAAEALRPPAARGDLPTLLDRLADWSDRYRLTWELDVEGHPLGRIADGNLDPGLIEAFEALAAVADEPSTPDLALDEPPAQDNLFADPADEDEPPDEGFQPRLFRPDGG
jgi:hypothetical protein